MTKNKMKEKLLSRQPAFGCSVRACGRIFRRSFTLVAVNGVSGSVRRLRDPSGHGKGHHRDRSSREGTGICREYSSNPQLFEERDSLSLHTPADPSRQLEYRVPECRNEPVNSLMPDGLEASGT